MEFPRLNVYPWEAHNVINALNVPNLPACQIDILELCNNGGTTLPSGGTITKLSLSCE